MRGVLLSGKEHSHGCLVSAAAPALLHLVSAPVWPPLPDLVSAPRDPQTQPRRVPLPAGGLSPGLGLCAVASRDVRVPPGIPPGAGLGVHEHWNNPIDRQYGRNLGQNAGIELVMPDMVTAVLDQTVAAILPHAARLSNHPNPFNGGTELAFELPVAGRTRLEVYDSLGQRVAVLYDEDLPSGSYAAVWDGRGPAGRDLASGIYIARLSWTGGEGGWDPLPRSRVGPNAAGATGAPGPRPRCATGRDRPRWPAAVRRRPVRPRGPDDALAPAAPRPATPPAAPKD